MMWEAWLIAWWVLCLGLAWWPCCCDDTPPPYGDCDECEGTGDNAPQYMTVEVAGFVDDNCADCENWNGTWLLEVSAVNPCAWLYRDGPLVCSHWNSDLNIQIIADSSIPGWEAKLDVTIYIASEDDACYERHAFEGNQDPVECLTTNGLTLSDSYAFSKGPSCDQFCDASSATVAIYSGDTT